MQPTASCTDSGGNSCPVEKTIGMPRFFAARARSRPGPLAGKPEVAEDQIDLFAVEQLDRVLETVERRDHLIAEVAEHHFIVEGGQRLILDDENPIDDALALPEQHPGPKYHVFAPATNEPETCAAASAAKQQFRARVRLRAKTGRSASPSCSPAPESPRAATSSG